MKRRLTKIATTLVALTAIAAIAQGCADRRYARGGVPATATVAAPAPAPAQRVTTTVVTTRTAPEPARPVAAAPAPAQPRVAVVQRPATVTGEVTQSAASSSSTSTTTTTTVVRKHAQTSPTVTEQILAPSETRAATAVQEEESQSTIVVRRDRDGRRIVAATNTSTPTGTLSGRPVFAVDDVPDNVARELEEYRLGPGDRLQIKVFGQDEISGEFEVSAAGELSFPLIGQITAENLTPGEFNRILSEALKEFFVNPQVTVEVTNYRPFFILGQVGNPGSYKYQPGLNARMAIAVGGGYTRRAKEEPITIFRSDSAGNLIKFDADQDAVILPGDTIEVHRRLF